MVGTATEDKNAVSTRDAINAGLRGPVIDAIQRSVPELRKYGREELYERVMSTPDLAALCFKVFRSSPQNFETVLAGPDGQRVSDDSQPLSCGRTLAQVISMIVRAIARRHFRSAIDGKPFGQFKPPPKPPSLQRRLARALGIEDLLAPRRRPAAAPVKRPPSPGDQMYRALYDFLLFEWQVQLIPEYARIPIETIRNIAPRILGAHTLEALRELATSTISASEPTGVATVFAVDSHRRPISGPNFHDGRSWQG